MSSSSPAPTQADIGQSVQLISAQLAQINAYQQQAVNSMDMQAQQVATRCYQNEQRFYQMGTLMTQSPHYNYTITGSTTGTIGGGLSGSSASNAIGVINSFSATSGVGSYGRTLTPDVGFYNSPSGPVYWDGYPQPNYRKRLICSKVPTISFVGECSEISVTPTYSLSYTPRYVNPEIITRQGELFACQYQVSTAVALSFANSSVISADRLYALVETIYTEQAEAAFRKIIKSKYLLDDNVDWSFSKQMINVETYYSENSDSKVFRFSTYVVYYDPTIKAIEVVVKNTIKANMLSGQVDRNSSRKLLASLVSKEELKARETLRDMISEADWRRYMTNGFLMIKGPKHNYWYQIFANHKSERLRVYENGKLVKKLCIHTDSVCPPTDHVINMKVMIECDEDDVWNGSNKYEPSLVGFGPAQIAARKPEVLRLLDQFDRVKRAA